MSAKKKIRTQSGIMIEKYQKSICIGGQLIFNGYPFNDGDISTIKNAMDRAYQQGQIDRSSEIRKLIGL